MPVTKRTRYEVLKRDNHTCRYCGGVAPDVVLWRPDAYGDSLKQMRNAGLTLPEMRDAALIALTNRGVEDRWRYFCGISWRKVGKLQEIAKSLLEADEVEEVR